MYNGFTYSHISGRLYLCSKRTRLHCKGKVKVDDLNNIVALEEIHNHDPQQFVVSGDGQYIAAALENGIKAFKAKRQTSGAPKQEKNPWLNTLVIWSPIYELPTITNLTCVFKLQLARPNIFPFGPGEVLYKDGYTYNKGNMRNWYCSKRFSKKCKAKVKLTKDGEYILAVIDIHTHAKDHFKVTSSGKLARIGLAKIGGG
ncbi:hypothetical protein NE865_00932 [Phthorimaea operculella]|nr:hypothetical protein NE865_00932 [Phthorimaea operculella]